MLVRRAFAGLARTVDRALHGRPFRPGRALVSSLPVVLVLWFACIDAHAQALDVFGQPTGATVSAASAPGSATAAPPWWSRDMPNVVRAGVGDWLRVQAGWNARIEGFLAQWSHGASLAAWATLIVVSFGYGALHALGPGHGKLVVATYLGSRRARVADAVLLCGWTAMVQAFSAIGLVLGASRFAHAGLMSVMPRAASMETVSYVLLCMTSAWAIRSSRARSQCCDEPPVVKLARDEDASARHPVSGAVAVGSRGESAEGAYLGARLTNTSEARTRNEPLSLRATTDRRAVSNERARSRIKQIATLGLAAGIRPCIGAIFALVGSMAARAPAAGVVATFAMAAGVATTVVLIGLGSIGANRTLARLALRLRIRSARTGRLIAIGAIGTILLISLLQLALLLSGMSSASFS